MVRDTWRVTDGREDIFLATSLRRAAGVSGAGRLDPALASILAPGWFHEGFAVRATLLEIVEQLDAHLAASAASASTSWLVARVAAALRDGRLEAYLVPREIHSGGAGKATEEAAPPVSARAPKAATTWIEILLVGEDDKPIPRERYRIELPDGSVREGTLNEKGLARLEGIEAGDCEVTFPSLDKAAWARA